MPPASRAKRRSVRPSRSALLNPHRQHAKDDAASLESRFMRLPAELAMYWKTQLVQEEFVRPLAVEARVLTKEMVEGVAEGPRLSIPRRPKWRYDSSSEYVQSNEEGLFRKWLEELDAYTSDEPTFVERNLEVYRQVWRTCEASDVICVLADARCPLLHFPDSLKDYVAGLKPVKPLILVLTKSDLVSGSILVAWIDHFARQLPGIQVIPMKSYLDSTGPRKTHQPGTDNSHMASFVSALQRAHKELCTPHPRVAADPQKLASWKPRVHTSVDWEQLLGMSATEPVPIEANGSMMPQNTVGQTVNEDHIKPYLSVGLIGQPNVGKSSLLNALLGRKILLSYPNTDQHLQTIFWSNDARFIDSPGLVSPSRVGLRMQVFAGVLPRQAMEATIALACRLMPLERILGFPHVKTTDELLTAYADSRSYVTAQAGRSDVSRAASEILRYLQTAKWAFLPPGSLADQSDMGIHLGGTPAKQDFDVSEADEEAERASEPSEAACDEETSDDAHGSEPEEKERVATTSNAFALLAVDVQ